MNPRRTPSPRFDKRRALSDIDGFAARIPGFDPSRYHDQQARRALVDAVARWPALARMLALAERTGQCATPARMETASCPVR